MKQAISDLVHLVLMTWLGLLVVGLMLTPLWIVVYFVLG